MPHRPRRNLCSRFLFVPLAFLAACQNPAASPTQSVDASRARLRLDQIKPSPQLPPDAAPAASEPVPQALRYLRTGQARFDEHLWADATTALEKALQLDPNLVEARVLLARAAVQHGNLSLAENHLKEALKLRPRDPEIHRLLGEIALQDHRYGDAIAVLRTALLAGASSPTNPDAVLSHLSLALALKEEGYLAAAADEWEAFSAAVAKPTAEMAGHRELQEAIVLYRGKSAAIIGDLHAQLGAMDRAIAAYQRAAAENPGDKSIRHRLTLALARGGRTTEAVELARKAVIDSPDDAHGLDLLKEVCDLSKEPDRFDAELVELARAVESPEMRMRLAKMLVQRKKTTEATEILSRIINAEPENTEAAYLLAQLYLDKKNVPQALEQVAKVLRDHPATYREASGFFFTLGTAKIDVSEVRAFVEQHPEDARAYFLLASAELFSAENAHDTASIEQAFKKCLQLDEKFAPAQILLGSLAITDKRWEEAAKYAKDAIDNGIADAQVYLIKGTALEALDQFQEAETALLEAFRLDRKSPAPLVVLAESAERRGETLRCEQLYRRILDDVDPRQMKARERLVRLLLNTHKSDKAREYFADFERLGQSGAEVDRCRALMDLAASRAPTGPERLEAYRTALGEMVKKYPKDPATYVELAMSYEAVGEFEPALNEINAALAVSPDDFRALDRKARYQAKLLDFEGAAKTTLALLKIRPRDLAYQQRLADFAISRGDLAEAVRQLRAMLKRDDLKDFREPVVGQLKSVLIVAKRGDDAVTVTKDWLDLAPSDAKRRRLYLDTLREAHREDDAVEAARQWLAADPTNDDLRAQYVFQLIEAKRHAEGQQRVLSWMAADPDDLGLHRLLILLCLDAKQWDGAIDLARTGAELSEQRGDYEMLLGYCYRAARRFDEAIEFYRERAGPAEGGRATRLLIETLIDAERFKEAEDIAAEAITPHQARRDGPIEQDLETVLRMREYLVKIYQLMGRDRQAAGQLEEIYRITPTDPGINNDLGYTWADAGMHVVEAEKMIRFAIGEQPTRGAYIDSLGWVLYKRGKFDEAIRYLRRAIILSIPEDAVLYDHLADALYRSDKIAEAKETWEKALAVRPKDESSPPNAEDRRVLKQIKAKLEALGHEKEVPVAPLAQQQPSSRPARSPERTADKKPPVDLPPTPPLTPVSPRQ